MVDDTAWGYIQKMNHVAPVVTMTVKCYHTEAGSYDTNESIVTTHVDKRMFECSSWVDASEREMPAISNISLTRLKIDPVIVFGDEETEAAFVRQKREMLDRNRHRDINMGFSSRRTVPGLKKRISAYVDLSVKPWWIGPGYFWLATVLMLSWPYRWLFRAKTGKSTYELKKRMYKSTRAAFNFIHRSAILPSVEVDQPNVSSSFALAELPSNATQSASTPYSEANQETA